MFVAQALYNFSKASLAQSQPNEEEQPLFQKQAEPQQEEENLKRVRDEQNDKQLACDGEDKFRNENELQENEKSKKDQQKDGKQQEIAYLTFEKGEKVLVEQAFQNGWWFGYVIKRPSEKGFFPSNYVKAGAKPPPPAPPQHKPEEEEEYEEEDEDAEADEVGDKLEQLKGVEQGPVGSDYYQGITRYKYVKINDNNKNILNASYVKFDAATGLARVPVKDQAPCAKAVRQMGYYFDYHQWNQQKNKNPEAFRNRPDPKKKNKKKKLRLLGMGKDA